MNLFIKKWLSSIRKYFFFYRDGFYELPYVANSPEMTVKSFSSMPFVKNYEKRNYFTINNLFLDGEGHYQKLEDGLWLIMSNMEVKKNLSFVLHYIYGVPSDYHFLTLYINKGQKTVNLPTIHFDIENQDRSWTLFKAGSKSLNTHFKGQKSIFFTIYFSDEWMRNNIMTNGIFKNKTLEEFFNSSNECLFLPNFLENKKEVYENLVTSILDKDENGVKSVLTLKKNTLDIISTFIEKLEDKSVYKANSNLSEKDLRRIKKAEYILSDSIFTKFPSIDYISKEIGMSQTKLKTDFKEVYGSTLYQYYCTKQMGFAKQMLEKEKITVKEVSYTLGYNNPSKFTAAFKKIYGRLPSET